MNGTNHLDLVYEAVMNKDANTQHTRPFPWKCGACNQAAVNAHDGEYAAELMHDGRSYPITIPSLRTFRCTNCGEVIAGANLI